MIEAFATQLTGFFAADTMRVTPELVPSLIFRKKNILWLLRSL
jgi:hypothetical protein